MRTLVQKIFFWLRIVTWNLRDKNTEPEKAILFVTETKNAHVACFQEVPDRARRSIKSDNQYASFFAVDSEMREGQKIYLAILIRSDIEVVPESHRVIRHNTPESTHWYDRRTGLKRACVESHSVCIIYRGQRVRIINCHLPATCSRRERENLIDEIGAKHTADPDDALFMWLGDFNTYVTRASRPVFRTICRIECGKRVESEVRTLEDIMKRYGIRRIPFGNQPTFRRLLNLAFLLRIKWRGRYLFDSWATLDHIGISPEFTLDHSEILPAKHQSDHCGLLADISLP